MASKRILSGGALSLCNRSICTPSRRCALFDAPTRRTVERRGGRGGIGYAQAQRRWHSEAPSSAKLNTVYQYEDIKKIAEKPSAERILIDVREPVEFEAGAIPSAVNVPISSQPDALFLPAEEFEDRFGFEKPAADSEVVFYCKAGVRSAAAAVMARESGYGKVGEYRGSWLDWEKNRKAGDAFSQRSDV